MVYRNTEGLKIIFQSSDIIKKDNLFINIKKKFSQRKINEYAESIQRRYVIPKC